MADFLGDHRKLPWNHDGNGSPMSRWLGQVAGRDAFVGQEQNTWPTPANSLCRDRAGPYSRATKAAVTSRGYPERVALPMGLASFDLGLPPRSQGGLSMTERLKVRARHDSNM